MMRLFSNLILFRNSKYFSREQYHQLGPWKFFVLPIPSSTSSNLSLENFRQGSSGGYRIPKKVYELGEKIHIPGERRKILIQEGVGVDEDKTTKDSSVTLFNTIMSELIEKKGQKKIVLEGTRLIEDALLINLKMEKLFILKSMKEVPKKIKSLMNEDVEIHKLGQKHMQLWSSVTTPPGVIGIFTKPKQEDIINWQRNQLNDKTVVQPTLPLTIICNNLREPGNLGSILRSAAGSGCKMVLLSKGSVDPWDIKVLRGGSGAQFRIPIVSEIPMFGLESYLDVGYSTCLEGTTTTPLSVGIFIADSDSDKSPKYGIPSVPYTNMDYTKFRHLYLLVGGETEGIGDDTLQIISSLKTSFINSRVPVTFSRIHISLQNRVESLNVANALGIITFEIRRQFDCQNFKT